MLGPGCDTRCLERPAQHKRTAEQALYRVEVATVDVNLSHVGQHVDLAHAVIDRAEPDQRVLVRVRLSGRPVERQQVQVRAGVSRSGWPLTSSLSSPVSW